MTRNEMRQYLLSAVPNLGNVAYFRENVKLDEDPDIRYAESISHEMGSKGHLLVVNTVKSNGERAHQTNVNFLSDRELRMLVSFLQT